MSKHKKIKPLNRVRICENCKRICEIDNPEDRKKHAKTCDFVWGRRGWRQLGAYDG